MYISHPNSYHVKEIDLFCVMYDLLSALFAIHYTAGEDKLYIKKMR